MENNNYNAQQSNQNQSNNAQAQQPTSKTPIYKKKGTIIGVATALVTTAGGILIWRYLKKKKANAEQEVPAAEPAAEK